MDDISPGGRRMARGISAKSAEWIARAEADDLRAVLDARQQWNFGRRLRWALGRRR